MKKYLVVNEFSKTSRIVSAYCFKTPSYSVWKDSGEIVNYPIMSYNKDRKTIRVVGKAVWGITFNALCKLFPKDVYEFAEDAIAICGTSLYAEDKNGFPVLHDSDCESLY